MKRAVLIIIAAAMALMLAGCVTNEQMRAYDQGVAAFERGDLEAAKVFFITADGYANSKSYLNSILEHERIYLEAMAFFDAHDYPAARHSLSSISSFANASEYIALIDRLEERYNEGLKAYEAKDYVLAKERFVQAQGYADSDSYVLGIEKFEDTYEIAMGYLREGNYLEALSSFERIGASYRDTDERIAELRAMFAARGVTAKQFLSLYVKSTADAGGNVAIVASDINQNAFAATTSDELLITGDTDDDGYILSVSFWLPKQKIKELGKTASNLIFVHCIRSLSVDAPDYTEIYADLDSYLAGSEACGVYSFSVDEENAGFRVLTAQRTPEE
ncbi:MAG: hypothetical protein J5586_05325 [Clostridia bacterium]|nr:hypothetical protein [Clostridia bacterium]